ncbi:hypothetical protein DXG01_007263 [Tephrocybe rancida]|nr:hypothetical protein DXG01_007263 [Tephrocybe rancida]
MGGLVSTAGAYKILDKHGDSREHFVLVLGSSGSGKSTLIKNMKLSNNGYSLPELLEFRQLIFKNVVESAQALILRARQLGFDYASKENYFLADDILSYVPEGELDPDIVEAIKKIWADRAIARTLRDPWGVVPFVDSAR